MQTPSQPERDVFERERERQGSGNSRRTRDDQKALPPLPDTVDSAAGVGRIALGPDYPVNIARRHSIDARVRETDTERGIPIRTRREPGTWNICTWNICAPLSLTELMARERARRVIHTEERYKRLQPGSPDFYLALQRVTQREKRRLRASDMARASDYVCHGVPPVYHAMDTARHLQSLDRATQRRYTLPTMPTIPLHPAQR
ncbi:hypothetical protein KIPB_006866 [Kipferlia bialata]|uniref:Uncharacterized protein n=1 Tax=Kipferlia bialata TaxID=797122 RepID=A0A9K3GK32_9EUKA|nr:hypothetical protein KIPB_006866 [Kipferlia bialata]|eukprot:g6866.t1